MMQIVPTLCRDSKAMSGFFQRHLGKRLRLDAQQQAKLAQLQMSLQQLRIEIRQQENTRRNDVDRLLSAKTLDQAEALRLLQLPTRQAQHKLPQLVASFADLFDSLDAQQHQRLQTLWHKLRHCSGRLPA